MSGEILPTCYSCHAPARERRKGAKTMDGIELKPCPFCGSDDVICDMFEDVYFVECWDCCAKVESYNGLEDAVAGWNARANKEGE